MYFLKTQHEAQEVLGGQPLQLGEFLLDVNLVPSNPVINVFQVLVLAKISGVPVPVATAAH